MRGSVRGDIFTLRNVDQCSGYSLIDGLVDQTRSLERVIAALDLSGVTIEGSDSLDNPGTVR
mgnify:CR=1 FL=1